MSTPKRYASSPRFRRQWRQACAALALALSLAQPAGTRADEVSGTWTGDLEVRGNYFLERSTRVIMPQLRLNVEAPNGIRVRGGYGIDVIASASIAQTSGSKDGVFTELRHGIGQMLVGKTIDAGGAEFDLSVNGTYSTEPDYKSLVYGLAGSVALDEKNTRLTLALTRVDDTVLSSADATFRKALNGTTLALGLEQLLSPVLKLNVGYQMTYLSGFLGNPYRRAVLGGRPRPGSPTLMGGLPTPEAPPDSRWRHNFEGALSWYVPQTWTTLQLYMRLYTDSWDIKALTPEPRIYQQIGPDLVLRLRYRHYQQTRADFAPEEGQTRYPVGYMGPVTNDPKMFKFHSDQIGLRLSYRLSFVSDWLFFMQNPTIDFNIDRGWTTSTFDNYWIASLGGRFEF